MMAASRLENVTQTIARILEGYDIRLRPNFGGKTRHSLHLVNYSQVEASLSDAESPPHDILKDAPLPAS